MITGSAVGFVEHGHLSGSAAHVIVLGGERTGDGLDPSYVVGQAASAALAYLLLRDLSEADARLACDLASQLGVGSKVAACVRPGVFLPSNALAYESILRVTDADIPTLTVSALDSRLGSISVHGWFGSGVMTVLAGAVPAPYGRYLCLDKADIGAAKVWLAEEPHAKWKIIPNYPLNDLEAAEIEEMYAHG
jgi:hypothetical protein